MFWILEKNKAGADEDDAFSKICALPESRQLDVADRRKKVFQTENRRVFFSSAVGENDLELRRI